MATTEEPCAYKAAFHKFVGAIQEELRAHDLVDAEGSLLISPAALITVALVTVFSLYVIYERITYALARRTANGPESLGLPFLGRIVEMVLNPVEFWDKQRAYNTNGVSINFILGRIVVFVTNPEACKRIFTSLEDFALFAHPNAKWLFGKDNLIYLSKNPHKAVRNFLQPALFNKEAFHKYLAAQVQVINSSILEMMTGRPIDVLPRLRKMNATASQEAFVGPYLTEKGEREQLAQDLITFTQGFLCFPCPLPGTGLWKAIKAKERIEMTLKEKARYSWKYIKLGGEPRCALDYVLKGVQTSDTDAINWNLDDVATALMDFLFASQDATTSALVWAMTLLDSNPAVAQLIRDEVNSIIDTPYNAHGDQSTFVENLIERAHKLTVTEKVAIEVLHRRPPVPMVPHLARKQIVIDGFTIRKGALVIPSITGAANNLPERTSWDKETVDSQFMQNLVFGAGQHKCPGRNYAIQTIKMFLAMVCVMATQERKILAKMPYKEQVMYMPTLFPVESLFVLKPREPLIATNRLPTEA